jgi:hypothetical protein
MSARGPRRPRPTPRQWHAIDLYAEGYSVAAVRRATGYARPEVYRILDRYGIRLHGEGALLAASDHPRLLTPEEIGAQGGGAWDIDRILAISEARTAAVEREVAETLARRAAVGVPEGEGAERAAA